VKNLSPRILIKVQTYVAGFGFCSVLVLVLDPVIELPKLPVLNFDFFLKSGTRISTGQKSELELKVGTGLCQELDPELKMILKPILYRFHFFLFIGLGYCV
jgi:hypothetical protein